MTIQVAVSNAYGVALASDRHVYRHGQTLSTGRQTKLARLRGPVPAAMMSAGSFSVLGFPVSRMALQFERALATAQGEGPDGMAHAVLRVLERPLEVKGCTDEFPGRDLEALARAAELVVGRAMAYGDAGTLGSCSTRSPGHPAVTDATRSSSSAARSGRTGPASCPKWQRVQGWRRP
jgi:hypothetical protein